MKILLCSQFIFEWAGAEGRVGLTVFGPREANMWQFCCAPKGFEHFVIPAILGPCLWGSSIELYGARFWIPLLSCTTMVWSELWLYSPLPNVDCVPKETLLHFAARHGLNSLAQHLLSLPGSSFATLLPNEEGKVPIQIAREAGNEGLVQLLAL